MTLVSVSFVAYFSATAMGDLYPLEHFGAVFAAGGDGGTVSSVETGSPAGRAGVEVGDRVVTIDGRPVRNTLDWAAVYARIDESHPLPVIVDRGGQRRELAVRFGRRPEGAFGSATRQVVLLSRAAQMVTLAFACLIFFRQQTQDGVLGSWLLATIGVYSVGIPPRLASVWHQLPVVLQGLFYLPSMSKAAVGLILLAFFRALLRRPLTDASGLAVMCVGCGCALWNVGFITATVYQPASLPAFTAALPAIVGVNLVALIVALVTLIRHYRALQDPGDRRRLRWVLVGSLVGLSAGAPTVAGLWLGTDNPTLIYDTPVGLQAAYTTFLVMPASFWWAIARRELFDLGFVARRGLQYLFARGALRVLAPLTLTLLIVEGLLLHQRERFGALVLHHGVLYGGVAAGLIVFRRRRVVWLDALDRRLFRERYDAAHVLRDLAAQLQTNRDLGIAAQFAVGQISSSLHPQWVAVYAADGDEVMLSPVAGASSSVLLPRHSGVLRVLRQRGTPMEVDARSKVWGTLGQEDRERITQLNVSLVVPIALGLPGPEAVMLLGPKKSGEPYGQEDRTLLHAVGASLGGLFAASEALGSGDSVHPGDSDWDTRLWRLADRVAEGTSIDWQTEVTGVDDEERRRVLLELQTLERLMDVAGSRDAVKAGANVPPDVPVFGGRQWGRFHLRRPLGRGRFGTVYRAWDPTLERDVALKLLEDETVDRDAYLREARMLARVRHPNVVHVYGADVQDEVPGFWMELVEGATLAEQLAQQGPLTAAQLLAVADTVCRALGAVHRAGLVHQDVKAENIMCDTDGRIVLMDLGAGLHAPAAPRWGTPRTMAPELFVGGPASVQSDVYSVGVLLCVAATGRYPVEGAYAEIAAHHHGVTLPILELARPDLPLSVRAAIGRAMAADPEVRYSSAEDLRLALAGEVP